MPNFFIMNNVPYKTDKQLFLVLKRNEKRKTLSIYISESENGTFSDRYLLEFTCHRKYVLNTNAEKNNCIKYIFDSIMFKDTEKGVYFDICDKSKVSIIQSFLNDKNTLTLQVIIDTSDNRHSSVYFEDCIFDSENLKEEISTITSEKGENKEEFPKLNSNELKVTMTESPNFSDSSIVNFLNDWVHLCDKELQRCDKNKMKKCENKNELRIDGKIYIQEQPKTLEEAIRLINSIVKINNNTDKTLAMLKKSYDSLYDEYQEIFKKNKEKESFNRRDPLDIEIVKPMPYRFSNFGIASCGDDFILYRKKDTIKNLKELFSLITKDTEVYFSIETSLFDGPFNRERIKAISSKLPFFKQFSFYVKVEFYNLKNIKNGKNDKYRAFFILPELFFSKKDKDSDLVSTHLMTFKYKDKIINLDDIINVSYRESDLKKFLNSSSFSLVEFRCTFKHPFCKKGSQQLINHRVRIKK